jgi:hypothetical protein
MIFSRKWRYHPAGAPHAALLSLDEVPKRLQQRSPFDQTSRWNCPSMDYSKHDISMHFRHLCACTTFNAIISSTTPESL